MDAVATSAKRATPAPAATSKAPAAPGFDAERLAALQDRVIKLEMNLGDVDAMANGALDRITTLAKLTLHYMKSNNASDSVDMLADVLEQIWYTAEEAQSYQDDQVRDAGLEPNSEKRNLDFLRAQKAA